MRIIFIYKYQLLLYKLKRSLKQLNKMAEH